MLSGSHQGFHFYFTFQTNFFLSCLSQVILESGHRVRAETYGDQTSLTIEITEREDSGNYKIVLQNEAGEATASVKIKVVGK